MNNDFETVTSVQDEKKLNKSKIILAIVFYILYYKILKLIELIYHLDFNYDEITSIILKGILALMPAYLSIKIFSKYFINKNKIIVNKEGMFIYKRKDIDYSFPYSSLVTSSKNEYDILLKKLLTSEIFNPEPLCVLNFIKKTDSYIENITLNQKLLKLMKNKYDLEKQFVLGVIKYRPDLRISPEVLEYYKI